jgi:hypothetical protein
MVFPTFGSSVKGGNKDAAFHTLTLVRLKGVGQGGLAMMSDLDMSGNKLMNAQAIDTANLTSSNGVINVINADMNIENNELRVKRFKTDELASKTGGAIDIRSNVRLANSDAQPPLPTGVIAYPEDNGEWNNWNDLEARDITCRTLNYTKINPSISGVIKNVYTAKIQEAKSLKSFYVNDTEIYTIAGVTGTDGTKLNLISTSSTDLSPATVLDSNKYVYNITARLNHLPDDHLAYFFVARNGNVNLEDMYVKGVKDTLVTLTGTTGDAVTEIKLYGAYSYSPNTNIEVAGQNTTSEKYVTVSDVVLTAFECTDITDKTGTSTTYTLNVTVKGLVKVDADADCIFVRLNGNQITQQLVEGVTGGEDRTVKFTIGTGSAYSITAFIPHNINVEIDTGASSNLTGTANDHVDIDLVFKQNFVLTVSVTTGVVGETMKLNLDGLSDTNTYNETISYSTSESQLFPQITTVGNYKLSVLPDDTGFINYQISASTVDPESFNISGTLTVNLTVIRLYKISVTVPTLNFTNGPLKVKLDYTGEVLTFSTSGTQSFLVGVPTGVKINIYSVESPNYQGIKSSHTVNADVYTFTGIDLTLTPLYSVSIIGTNLTNNEVKLTLKTDAEADVDITENYYNVRCLSTYTNAFSVTTTAVSGIKYNDVNTTIVLNGTPTPVPVEGLYTITDLPLVFYYTDGEVYIISGTSGGTLTNSVKSATRDVYFDLILTGTSLTGSSTETHTTDTYEYTVQEGRLETSTFNYLNTGIITGTPDLEGTSSITLKSTNTSGIFPYRLINDTTVKVTDDQGTSYKTLSNQTITIPSADVVDTITFIPLSAITVNLVNLVPGRDIILAVVNINGQTANPALGANVFNIPTTGTATLTLTYVTAEYNLGTTPTTTTIDVDNVNNTIATFAISGSTYNITMLPLYTATLDLALMNVLNSKLTFTYNNVPYTIIANEGNNFTINNTTVSSSTYTFTSPLPFASALPSITPSYFPDKNLTTTGFSSLSWSGETDNLVDGDETLTFSLGYYITIGNDSTISLYKHTEFKTIFNDEDKLSNLTITAGSQLAPTFIKDDIYYLISTRNIPNFYGIISNSSITLAEETLYALTTATSGALTDVNFKLESTGTLNHFDYYEIMKDVGVFKTPLYSTNGYTVGATYISTASTVTPTGNIFYNTVITDNVTGTVTVTIPNGTENYTESNTTITNLDGSLSNGTYNIRGNLLGGQYLINDLTFTYNGTSFTINSGSAVRLYSNVECNVNLFVNVATPIGGTYADSKTTITYVSGDYTGGAFTIDGSKLGGGGNLTGASIDGTTKAITGTFAGDKPQYFTNVPADAVGEVVNTFDVKYTPNANIIITLNTNTDTFSGGTTGQAYTLTNFEGTLDLTFTLKGISTIQTGTISSGQTLTFTPTYNISGTNAYTAVNAELSVNTATPITKIVNAGTYTINSLQLLQGATRILSITSSKHLFNDYSLSRTFTTPASDQTLVNLIAREESITFTFIWNGSSQTIDLSNVKRTGADNSSSGSANENDDGNSINLLIDLLIAVSGTPAATYGYTATLSGNGLVKNFTTTSLAITLVQIKIQIPSTGTFTLNNFIDWGSSTFALTSGSNTISNYGFLSDSYTLTGTYTNTSVSMIYSVSIGTVNTPSPYTFNLELRTLTVTFPDDDGVDTELVDQVILELHVNNAGTYTQYSDFTFDGTSVPKKLTHDFLYIPPGCEYKLKRVTGGNDSTQTFTADGFSLATPDSFWGGESQVHTMPNANKTINFQLPP